MKSPSSGVDVGEIGPLKLDPELRKELSERIRRHITDESRLDVPVGGDSDAVPPALERVALTIRFALFSQEMGVDTPESKAAILSKLRALKGRAAAAKRAEQNVRGLARTILIASLGHRSRDARDLLDAFPALMSEIEQAAARAESDLSLGRMKLLHGRTQVIPREVIESLAGAWEAETGKPVRFNSTRGAGGGLFARWAAPVLRSLGIDGNVVELVHEFVTKRDGRQLRKRGAKKKQPAKKRLREGQKVPLAT